MTPERKSSMMLALLGLLIFVYHVGAGIQIVNGLEPSPSAQFLFQAAFLCGVIWWLRAQGRSAVLPVYCQGMIVSIGWLIIIPYHLIKTRGAEGLFPLAALMLSFVSAQIVTVILNIVLLAFNPP